MFSRSLRSCSLPIIPLSLSREEGMIHFFVGSHVKRPESGLFSDWIGNNMDDLRCSNWPKCRYPFSLRSCPLPIISLCLSREEGMIHFFVGSHVKKPESGLFSDWIGNNMDDLRCSNWPKCRHPFSLRSCPLPIISLCLSREEGVIFSSLERKKQRSKKKKTPDLRLV